MRIDLHCHSKYSDDNHLEPEEVIEQAIQLNLGGVCFTEHHSMTPLWALEKIGIPEGFYVFRGVEISTGRGHLLLPAPAKGGTGELRPKSNASPESIDRIY
jgi:predicted metal-dependent phosphoesterase TrpH